MIRWYNSVDRLRLILTFLLCINLYGIPFGISGTVQTVLGFVPPAFFVISGFLVLIPTPDIKESIFATIKKSAITLAALAAFYISASYVFGKVFGVQWVSELTSADTWVDFLIFNIWPFKVGSIIWYVQAYLYAYLIIALLNKTGLLKYDWIIALVLFVICLVTGEFANVLGIHPFGREYISGNFFTRALPYILLGGRLRKESWRIEEFGREIFPILAAVGVVFITIEMFVLQSTDRLPYYGHLFGMAVTAPAVCLIAFRNPDRRFNSPFVDYMSMFAPKWIIFICPVAGAFTEQFMSLRFTEEGDFSVGLTGIITFFICFAIVGIIGFIRYKKEINEYIY